MLICILTGFTSGLPLFILISLLPAWLSTSGIDLKTIGLFALIQFPFTWKFIWAPIFDRFSFGMGRRRGWLIIFQLLLYVAIMFLLGILLSVLFFFRGVLETVQAICRRRCSPKSHHKIIQKSYSACTRENKRIKRWRSQRK